MHPIRAINSYIRTRLENRRINCETAEFIAEVNTHVRVYGLDPNLPEIVSLREHAREIIADPFGAPDLILSWLNPYDSCVVHRGQHVTIYERMFGHVLHPISLIEHHLKDYTLEVINRVQVDGSGTRLYAYNGQEVALYHAGVLNPHRLADPGNRVRNAVAVVEHFTGLSLDWEDLWRHHWAEFNLDEDGTWQIQYDPEPVTVSS